MSSSTSNPENRKVGSRVLSRWASHSREWALVGMILCVTILFSILYPYSFCSWANFNAVLRNLAFEGLLALGMMVLLISGSFDLSAGSMASMIGVITGWLMKEAGCPVPLAVLAGLMLAALCGAGNGLLVARFRVNALITTLGTMGIFQGVALLVGGPGITFLPDSFTRWGRAEWLGVQGPVWLLAGLALLFHLFLTHFRFFRQYYYIGSNAHAARLSGIRVERMQIAAFALMGIIAGLAGIVYASRIATATASLGVGAELKAIAAVILGGASLSGGKGTIWGAMLGVFFMALIQNVLIISRVSSEWQGIVLGCVLVGAVAVDSWVTGKQIV
ncbi:MAG: ABC transporter permease [Pirellulaceae bacterium]|jgi:ribose/xylose/arabinose/galactoside ABC-type transport system permease subunit